LGFEALGEYGMRQRRFFRRKRISPVNLHIFEDTDPEVERHLRFCNYLKSHPEKVKEYSSLKKRLVDQYPAEINPYVLGKDKFIKEIDVAAAKEAEKFWLEKKERGRKKEWSEEEMKKAVEVNMRLHKTYFAKCTPSLSFVFQPDITIVRSKIKSFNFALSAKFTEKNAKVRMQEIKVLFENTPFSWWIFDSDTPPHLDNLLKQEGFTLKNEYSAMVRNLQDIPAFSMPREISIQRVENQKQLKDFSGLQGFSEDSFNSILCNVPSILYKEGSSYEMHVAYSNGKAVVAGVLLFHANVAGVYDVVSREKDLFSLMISFLLSRAKGQGFFLSLVQVPKEEKRLCESAGFKSFANAKEYTYSACNFVL
jgi:hypothetical protein